eukprot:4826222-Pyramimonas_sp.AAC.1
MGMIMAILKKQATKTNALNDGEMKKLTNTIKEYAIEMHDSRDAREGENLNRALKLCVEHIENSRTQAVTAVESFGQITRGEEASEESITHAKGLAKTVLDELMVDIKAAGLGELHKECPAPVWAMLEGMAEIGASCVQATGVRIQPGIHGAS